MPKKMADASHWQSSVDFSKYKLERIGLKTTEGSAVDPDYLPRVASAHAHHKAVDHYCFAIAGNAAAQAKYFVETVAPHFHAGDRVVIDAEAVGVNGALAAAFIAEVVKLQPHWPAGLIYGSPYFLKDNHIVSSHGWGLWLADYTNASKPVMIPPGFPPSVAYQWQYSSGATVAGVSGKCDISRIIRGPKSPLKSSRMTPFQRRHTKKFTSAMNDRKHPFVPTDLSLVDTAIVAANHAKGIKS